jgi:hypothetical protein
LFFACFFSNPYAYQLRIEIGDRHGLEEFREIFIKAFAVAKRTPALDRIDRLGGSGEPNELD